MRVNDVWTQMCLLLSICSCSITVLTFISWLGCPHLASVARNSTSGTCLEGSKRLSSPKRFLLAHRGQYIKMQSISTLTITLIDTGLNLKKNYPVMKETSSDSTVLPSPMISQIRCSLLYQYRQNKRKWSRKELIRFGGLKFHFRNALDLCKLIGTAGLQWNQVKVWWDSPKAFLMLSSHLPLQARYNYNIITSNVQPLPPKKLCVPLLPSLVTP